MDDRAGSERTVAAMTADGNGRRLVVHRARHARRAHRVALTPIARFLDCEIRLHAGEALLLEIATSVLMTVLCVVAVVLIPAWWTLPLVFVVLMVEVVALVGTLLDVLSDSGGSQG